MSDLDRILKLAGREATAQSQPTMEREMKPVQEASGCDCNGGGHCRCKGDCPDCNCHGNNDWNESVDKKMVCKDCGDEFGHPTTDCENNAYDKDGDHWIEIDIDGDGVADIKVADPGMKGDVEEAVGDAAAPLYDLVDAHGAEAVLDELARYLDVDQIEDFVADYRRHRDMDEAAIDEADLDENAFNQAAAAAARAGKSEFEFNGKKYKTKMDKSTAHKLDDDVQFEAEEAEEETEQNKYDGHDIMSEDPPNGIDYDYANLSKVNWAQYSKKDIETFYSIVDNLNFESGYYGDVDDFDDSHSNALKWLEDNVLRKDEEETLEEMEVVSEAPTMDTTQLITVMKLAGLSEETINKKLTEWANSAPEAAEQESTSHGEPYENFAQSVNLSLKRYLDAENMKVTVSEHTVENMKALYESKKSKS